MALFQAAKADYEEAWKEEDPALQAAKVNSAHAKHATECYKLAKTHGGIYCKAAQFVASLQGGAGDKGIPSQYIEALSALTDQANSLPFETASACLIEDLEKTPEELFEKWCPEAIAAASLAQVHDVTMKNGTRVALKLQYPDLRKQMASDFTVFQTLGAGIQPGGYDLRWLATDIEKFITQELDFTIEAKNSENARRLLAHRRDVMVPAVVPDIASQRVLCTTFVDGLQRLDGPLPGMDRAALGLTVAEVFAQLPLLHGVVHGDPHAGNVYARARGPAGPQVVVLDHGLHHHLVEEDRLALCHLIRACCLGSRGAVRRHGEHFAGPLWRLFPLVLNPTFAFAVVQRASDIQAARASRLPDDVSLEDVWKAMLAMHESDSDILGALHSLGYVRGLLNSLGVSERVRVLALARAATYGLYPPALRPGASAEEARTASAMARAGLWCSLATIRFRVELLFILLACLAPFVAVYLRVFGKR